MTSLKRPFQPMPDFVEGGLLAKNLMDAFKARPPYQKNDYLAWINRAKKRRNQTEKTPTNA